MVHRTLAWPRLVLVGSITVLVLNLLPFAVAQNAPVKHADFYVATDGNDNWSGSLDAPNAGRTNGPFASLERARRAVQDFKKSHRDGPVIVMLRQGTYFLDAPLKFSARDSGSSNAPIVYEAYPGEKALISGGKRITAWKLSGGRWTASLDPNNFRYFEQLFVNEVRRYRPRTTKQGYLYNAGPVFMDSPADNCKPFSQPGGGYECFDRFRFKDDDLQNYQNIGDVEIDDFEKWTMSKMRLKSVDAS